MEANGCSTMTISGRIQNTLFAKTPVQAEKIYSTSGKLRLHALDPKVIASHNDLTDLQHSLPDPDKISLSHRSYSATEQPELHHAQATYNRIVRGMRTRKISLKNAQKQLKSLQGKYDKNPVAHEALRERLGNTIGLVDDLRQTQRDNRIELRNLLVDFSALRLADKARRSLRAVKADPGTETALAERTAAQTAPTESADTRTDPPGLRARHERAARVARPDRTPRTERPLIERPVLTERTRTTLIPQSERPLAERAESPASSRSASPQTPGYASASSEPIFPRRPSARADEAGPST